jgi:acetyl esterase
MTLDPQAEGLLEQLRQQGVKDFSDMSLEEARGFMRAFIALEGDPEDLAEVRKLAVPGPDGHQIPVRTYRPATETPPPVLMYFHGGGYVLGDLEVADRPCRQLANATGCLVVSVDYRLAPEHKAPVGAQDCYAATEWVARHAGELGGCDDNLAVSGDSAGGGLAAIVALMARDRGGPRVRLQLLIYPMIDAHGQYPSRADNGDGYLLTRRSLQWFADQYLAASEDATDPYVSPIHAPDLTGLPGAVVITAGYDPLHDEGEAYADRLEQAGVPLVRLPNPAMIHGFMWMNGAVDHTASVYQRVGELVREHLGSRASAG